MLSCAAVRSPRRSSSSASRSSHAFLAAANSAASASAYAATSSQISHSTCKSRDKLMSHADSEHKLGSVGASTVF